MTETSFEITLARMNTGDFRLEITDEVSRARVLTAEFGPEVFANMVTARLVTRVAGQVYSDVAPHWGVDRQERKTVVFPFKHQTFDQDLLTYQAMLADDGWTLPIEKLNQHRVKGGQIPVYEATAWRWVRAEEVGP